MIVLAVDEGYRHRREGAYCPLTTNSIARDAWMAHPLGRPGLQEGMVVPLRRPKRPHNGARVRLSASIPEASCDREELDSGRATQRSRRDLLDTPGLRCGLEIG
jgi:hypothetical protein